MKTKILGIIGCIVLACFLTGGLCGAQEWEWQGQININSAMEATLELLPGVDFETALNIVAFRESNGPFSTVDDLMMVKGIDEDVMEQIRPYVSTEKETELQYRQ
ncbi:MAG TPA: helix-hairpin-helix domain-containing protein [Deltaproteobacteria bacterium]|nr:helix-hairpin-helix domain-containing protein [Deltaproteobacteria bacterium]HPJ95025.1 helix-hairpin-helix domain-containing protein [Deltaproteobacteria bacterium]HPR52653.1 helix-hairpin-helix domain-containing protein [Deltaproteobacteria bacterium]